MAAWALDVLFGWSLQIAALVAVLRFALALAARYSAAVRSPAWRLRSRLGRAADARHPIFDDVEASLGAWARLVWQPGESQPFTLGARPAYVVLPGYLQRAPDATLRQVMTHELLHVARGDWGWVAAEELVRTAFWFHPAIWLLVAEARLAREEIVDRETVGRVGNRRAYLTMLVEFAERGARPSLGSAIPLFRSRQLARRVAALLSGEVMSTPRRLATSTLVAVAVSAAVVSAARAFPIPNVPSQDANVAAPAASPSMTVGVGKTTGAISVTIPAPVYPEAAKTAGVSGLVEVEAKIDATGRITAAKVTKSVPMLDGAAVAAARASKFQPGTKDGKPVPVVVTLTFEFRLK